MFKIANADYPATDINY